MPKVSDISFIKLKIASPEEILSWSQGEVTKPETINYRTQRAEKDGLFCQKIFGPEKDYECYCGKYRSRRYKGVVCDRCGVEVTRSSVRRERMGHIKLAVPVAHIWFLRGVPSAIGVLLDIPVHQAEKIIYFSSYIITKVDNQIKDKVLKEIEREYKVKSKIKNQKSKIQNKELETAKTRATEGLSKLKKFMILSEIEYQELGMKYGEVFEAETGTEALQKLCKEIDFNQLKKELKKKIEKSSSSGEKKSLQRRLRFVQYFINSKIKPEWMLLTVIPVIPPELRPMVQLDGGRYASSDLNDLYRRVINRNNRLKYLQEIGAPEVICRNEKRMLQEAVDALIDNSARSAQTTTASTGGRRLLKSLADMLKGKQGRFRQNLLGKRVDYSGRSVIVVGPELKLNQCGLPKKMALELFKPFVIQKITEKELAYNVRGAGKIIDETPDIVWEILEGVIKNKYVLLNRAPTLHRLGIEAFHPVLIEGEAIQVHPLVCLAFNADFDGDQMAVHLPLSEEAQKEAREIMLSSLSLLKPATGFPTVVPRMDIVLGCYWLTKIKDKQKKEIFGLVEEALMAYEFKKIDIREPIIIQGGVKNTLRPLETSVGRVLFNETLPDDFPFLNEVTNSKTLEKLTAKIIKKYGNEKSTSVLDKIKTLGFEAATQSGISWGMDDLQTPPQKEKLIREAEKKEKMVKEQYQKGLLTSEERYRRVIGIWQQVKDEITCLVPETLDKEASVFSIIDSGSRGSWSQPSQMAGMKGLVINPMAQIMELPVKSSYKEGFNALEYFISTHGGRKGTTDTALRTSSAGYLTRRLVDVAHDVIIREEKCKDTKGIQILRSDAQEIGQDFAIKIIGRIAVEDIILKKPKTQITNHKQNPKPKTQNLKSKILVKRGEIINEEKARLITNSSIEKIRVFSPITCRTREGVCRRCYGWDLGSNELVKLGGAVGVIAAQAIGEPGTQLTLRTFHTGGVAGGEDITRGLPRVEEIFETRTPRGEALISEVHGRVKEIKEKDGQKIIKIKINNIPVKRNKNNSKTSKKEKIKSYQVPIDRGIRVEKGDLVYPGQAFSEGNIDPKKLYKLGGIEGLVRYILKEIQKIYISGGAVINDRHIEVIIRQMLSRVKIKDPGNSKFGIEEIISKDWLNEENSKLEKENKKIAKTENILLGITKTALTTRSFLSAASFQETSRILIKAAIEGKEDPLRGLKENVIIGKLIPAGTGFWK